MFQHGNVYRAESLSSTALRRDNLSAALHMFVETIFWFPLVWWIIEGKKPG
jgi:hypothetical protein